jgi:CheY-like chemotaxis protein
MPVSNSTIASPAQSRSQQQLLTTWQGSNIGTLNNQDLLFLTILKQSQGSVEAPNSMSAALRVLQLQLRAYDLLLSDLGLPEIDGWTLTTEAKGNIPTIALTAYGIERYRKAAWLLGFQMLLSRPLA